MSLILMVVAIPCPRVVAHLAYADKIVLGTFSGMLRVYYPRGSVSAGYRVEDLMMEENLGLPILQLAVGKFVP